MKRKALLIIMLMAMFAPLAMNAQDGLRPIKGIAPASPFEFNGIQNAKPTNENTSRAALTINDGTETCAYMPIWGQAVGNTAFSQFIIPAESMATMAPEGYMANITELRFYASNSSVTWGNDVQFIVFLKEVEETEFTNSYYSWNEMINNGDYYYFGSLSVSRGAMAITLDDAFQYFGGNLLIGFYEYTAGTSASVSWYGNSTDATNTVLGYGSNAYGYGFLPKIQFTYTQEESTCVVPADLDLFGITQTMAGLYWNERGESTEWELSYSTTSGDPDNGTIVPVTEGEPYYLLDNLTEGTIYYAYVRSICDGNIPTDWSNVLAFRTPATCDVPSDIEVSNITQVSADVEWWGYDESYDVRYRQQSAGHDIANFIEHQVGRNTTTTGDFADYTFSLSSYSGDGYVAIRHYNVSNMFMLDVASVTVKDASGTVVFEGDLTKGIPDGWYAVDYDGDGYNWSATSGFVYSESYSNDTGEALNPDNWLITPSVPLGGSVVVNAKGQDPSYASEVFGVFVSTTRIVEYDWTTVENNNGESYAIAGLNPQTTYEVQVRAHSCPGDWSESITFTTLSGCDAPVGLNTTDITATTATLSWTEALDEYNVRYREGFVYDFESASPWAVDSFDPCTTYDGDGSVTGGISGTSFTNQGYTGSFIAFQNGLASNLTAHGGNAFGACFYATTPANNDWFILPAITIQEGDYFTFWARSLSSKYVDTFIPGIYGERGNFSTAFSETIEAPVAWTEYSYDLSAYVGQTIQLAINCNSDDKFALFLDDIFVGNPSWSTVSVTGATHTLEGLDPNTTYQWQVQGVNCDGNGSDSEWNSASFTTLEAYIKHIDPYTTDGGYYLIASPIGEVSPKDVTNMLSNSYDLYYFEQNPDIDPETGLGLEWINYKNGDGFDLQPGKGYLYANSGSNNEGIDLIFSGSAYTESGEVTLALQSDVEFEGMNLVGNPFAVKAYIADGRDFYRMNEGGAEIMTEASTGSIEPMEGVFVYATEADESMTFTTTEPTNGGKMLALNLSQNNGVIDRAIVRFGEGRQLPKFQLRKNSTKVYIEQDNKDFAVVSSEAQGEMPVSFKAENNGTYTLSFNNENVEFSYLHLIDNMTGNEVDLLENPSYSFEAKTTDYAQRFRLVFSTGNASDDNFAFYTNGAIVINNEGNATMKVYDVTGRMINSQSINGSCQVNLNAPAGVYMIQLVNGDNTKTQKIVVK